MTKIKFKPDLGDEEHKVSTVGCDLIYKSKLKTLKTFGYNESDILGLLKQFNFPNYIISLFLYKDDKLLYDNDYESYLYIHKILDNKWKRRELRVKSVYRTVIQTALDLSLDALVEQIFMDIVAKHNIYKLRISDNDKTFELLENATLTPDFIFGKNGKMEMKTSSGGFNDENTEFHIKRIKDELTSYDEYVQKNPNFFFLRIDYKNNKLAVIRYDEFNKKTGIARFNSNRVQNFNSLETFVKGLETTIHNMLNDLYLNKNKINGK